MFETICDIVVLTSAALLGIINILKFFNIPIRFVRKKYIEEEEKRITKVLEERLPNCLYQHDLEVRDKYKSDRQRYLEEIKTEVVLSLQDTLSEIKKINEEQAKSISTLASSSRDILREKIMGLYHKNKNKKMLEHFESKALEQYYKDYKAEDGNSYIDEVYKLMKKWAVGPAPEDELK